MKINPLAHQEQALRLRAFRTEMLISNIANADTPNYKARDIDFASALRDSVSNHMAVRKTNAMHLAVVPGDRLGVQQKYRVPMQPSLDGNTVETDIEQAAFAENAVRYRANLSFLDGQIKGLRFAIKGGD